MSLEIDKIIPKQAAFSIGEVQLRLGKLSSLCLKTQNRIGFLYDHKDSIEDFSMYWADIKQTAAVKAAWAPGLAKWIQSLPVDFSGTKIATAEALREEICDQELPKLTARLADLCAGGVDPQQSQALGDCLSLCDTYFRDGAPSLTDGQFSDLARASMAIPEKNWTKPKLDFTWDDKDARRSRENGALPRGHHFLMALAKRPGLPACQEAAQRLDALGCIDWSEVHPLISLGARPGHSPTASADHKDEARFWMAATRRRDPSWIRAHALAMGIRAGIELTEEDFSFQTALEAALLCGSAKHAAMAIKAKPERTHAASIAGLPLATLAAASAIEPQEKLELLRGCGVDLAQRADWKSMEQEFRRDNGVNNLTLLMHVFEGELGPLLDFLRQDGRLQEALLHLENAQGNPREKKGNFNFSSTLDPSKITTTHIDGLDAAAILRRRMLPETLQWLANLGPAEALRVKSTCQNEFAKTPSCEFFPGLAERMDSAGFPMSQAELIQWWFTSGWGNTSSSNRHSEPFAIGFSTVQDFEFLRERGSFEGEGPTLLFNEAMNGAPERLRYAKLAAMQGIEFSPEQNQAMEDRIHEQSQFNGALFREDFWIDQGALAVIESFEMTRLSAAGSPPKPSPRL